MICSEFNELLDNYASITDEQRIEMEKHTAECETCRKELEFFTSVMSSLASVPSPEAPKTLIDKVNAKLDAEKTVVVGFKWNLRVLSTVAACLAIGLAVGINNGYIKDAITDNGTDGVISQTVTKTPDAVETPAEVVVVPENEEKAEEKPVAKQEKSVKPIVSEKVTTTQKPTVAVKEAPSKAETIKPAKSETVPTQTEAPAPTPGNVDSVEEYRIKSDGPQIAYGRYNVDVSARTTNEFSDYLHVQSDDMGAVVSTMSEMGVKNSGGYYMTSRQNFYALMDTLNDKGVGYECDLKYNSGENISFRLTYQ